jgi:hypothetical protein
MNTYWLVESSYYDDGTLQRVLPVQSGRKSVLTMRSCPPAKWTSIETGLAAAGLPNNLERLSVNPRRSRYGNRREGGAGCVRVYGRRETSSIGLVGESR